MSPLDRRIGELMVRLRLSRPPATRRALDEGETGEPPSDPGRKSSYGLAA